MNEASILLVDDEPAILQMIETVLRKEGFVSVARAHTAAEALAACENAAYDLIVLDVMLPDGSGVEICPFLRRLTDAPILFLSARASDFDKLTGFAVGGDDYVTKPFNPLEVVARIRALLRRSRKTEVSRPASGANATVHEFGRFQVREEAGELWVEGRQVGCPSLVFQLLLFMCKHPNRFFSKSELYERVWGESSFGDDNTVMVHIHRIRERIEADPSQPEYLVNVRGMGYKLVLREDGHEH